VSDDLRAVIDRADAEQRELQRVIFEQQKRIAELEAERALVRWHLLQAEFLTTSWAVAWAKTACEEDLAPFERVRTALDRVYTARDALRGAGQPTAYERLNEAIDELRAVVEAFVEEGEEITLGEATAQLVNANPALVMRVRAE
jgi:hypothetical protein